MAPHFAAALAVLVLHHPPTDRVTTSGAPASQSIAHGSATGLAPATQLPPPAVTSETAQLALETFLGPSSPISSLAWHTPTGDNTVLQAYAPGVLLAEVDRASGEVRQVVFEGALTSAVDRLSQDEASHVASQFAANHFVGFSSLTPETSGLIDHGVFKEFRFTWTMKDGNAWLPTSVTVGVNIDSGTVTSFVGRHRSVSVGSTPSVAADTAVASAKALIDGESSVTPPTLKIVIDDAGQDLLVWELSVTKVFPPNVAYVPLQKLVWVDAISGTARTVAST